MPQSNDGGILGKLPRRPNAVSMYSLRNAGTPPHLLHGFNSAIFCSPFCLLFGVGIVAQFIEFSLFCILSQSLAVALGTNHPLVAFRFKDTLAILANFFSHLPHLSYQHRSWGRSFLDATRQCILCTRSIA